MMGTFLRLTYAEALKVRRSSVLRLLLLLPLVFLVLDFWFFRRPLLSLQQLTPAGRAALEIAPIQIVAAVWAGFFHPLLLALLPTLLVRAEHRFSLWKHLYIQPIAPGTLFLAKAILLLLLMVTVGLALQIGLWAEGAMLARLNPVLGAPFPWLEMTKVLGWLFLGSMPLLALYLWLSHRVNHGAVPIALGLIGLVLSIALSRGEMNPPWQRDFIPWVTPYVCTQRAVEQEEARQSVHLAAKQYKAITVEEQVAKEIKAGLTARQLPWVFPPPTPLWQLASFSLLAWVAMTLLGIADVQRRR